MKDLRQAYIDSELLDIDETDCYQCFQAGYKEGVVWKEKLTAFMEGLEIQNIPEYLENANVEDFRNLGMLITQITKNIKRRLK